MELGIVGLPNVGKSTLFNAITRAGAMSANYPFCTIEPNVGIVDVKDERLNVLAKIYNTQKITPAQVKFVDIAGLVKGASEGAGLGNKFLSHIREVDAIVEVVRCFKDDNIIHVDGSVDALRDIETINLELILSDIETIEKRLSRVSKIANGSKDEMAKKEMDLLLKIKEVLSNGMPARSLKLDDEENLLLKQFFLITSKPIIYVANTSEELDDFQNQNIQKIKNYANNEGAQVVVLCAKLEEDLLNLDDDEREMFFKELNISSTGLDKLIVSSFNLLGLQTFLTAGEKEVRAWTIKKGTLAPQAAGVIHSDFERGFIRAEIVKYNDLVECGDFNKAREKGKMISAGKDYVMQDGDVVNFKFNV